MGVTADIAPHMLNEELILPLALQAEWFWGVA
jgi:hypothetical protein